MQAEKYDKLNQTANDAKGGIWMRSNKGTAVLLFAILLQLCSTGMELLTLAIGLVGLIIALSDDSKSV